jgi:flagellar biosynthesis GTPase FlhF
LLLADPAKSANLKSNYQENNMTLKVHNAILFTAFLLAGPRLMFSQEPPVSQQRPAQKQAESAAKELKSPEEALEQLYRQVAAIHREMAVILESDTAGIRELKGHFARLAEQEEQAALAAKTMAASHARLAAFIGQSPETTKHVNYGDSGYRK